MSFDDYLHGIRQRLISSHAELIDHLAFSDTLLLYHPDKEGWNIREILEHVGLTSHFLLILIDKSAIKARRKMVNAPSISPFETITAKPNRLDSISNPIAFAWHRPDHMEPTGQPSLEQLADQFNDQLSRCLRHLEALDDGAGFLHTTTMTVAGLGRLNVYEYIEFLARHAERHLQQIAKVREEYNRLKE